MNRIQSLKRNFTDYLCLYVMFLSDCDSFVSISKVPSFLPKTLRDVRLLKSMFLSILVLVCREMAYAPKSSVADYGGSEY